jgi:hypothetical protein
VPTRRGNASPLRGFEVGEVKVTPLPLYINASIY